MSSNAMYQVIKQIRRARGTNLKKYILEDHPELKDVLKWAYDPYIRFNVTPNAAWIAMPGEAEFSDETYRMLEQISTGTLSGNAARNAVRKHLKELSYDSGCLLLAILAKTLDFGLAAKSINSIFPGLIPSHPIQLAKAFDPKKCTFPCFVSPKLDGLRAVYKKGKFYSRQGHIFQGLTVLTAEMTRLLEYLPEGIEFDGELMVDGEHFNEISGQIRAFTEADNAHYYIYDIPNLGNEQWKRLAILNTVEPVINMIDVSHISIVPHHTVTSIDEVYKLYGEYLEAGHEGAMVKKDNGVYYDGRNDNWLKLKNVLSADCPIVDVFEGEGKYAGMCGGLVVKYEGVKVKVGSGLTDRQRHYWWTDPDEVLGRIAEIAYHEVTPSGSLRHPRFKSLRGDK